MGKKDEPKAEDKDEYAPGTVKGELEFYDKVTKPVKDALDAAKEWQEQGKRK